MKVAVSFPGFFRSGGAERVAFEVARHLAQAGHDVHVFAEQWQLDDEVQLTYHTVRARRRPWFLLPPTFYRRCSALLDAREFDAVAALGAPSPLGGVFWAQSVHREWLAHSRRYRGRMSVSRWKQRLNPAHPILLRLERKHMAPGAHSRIVALTAAVRADLHRWYGVDGDRVDVLPVGFDPSTFDVAKIQDRRSAVRTRLGYGEDDQVVLFVANELERKGFRPLLRAVAALADPRIKVMVVGRGRPEGYHGEISALGLHDAVRFTGAQDDVASMYAAGDVLALPTQYEAWGLVIVEAMACGLPVVVSASAGAAAVVRSGVTGELLSRPDDPAQIAEGLSRVLQGDHASADEISRSVQDYTWDRVLGRFEEILFTYR